MTKKERVKSALTALFPTSESIVQFEAEEENANSFSSLISVAFKHNLIDRADKSAFLNFIQENILSDDDIVPPKKLNFETFLDQKSKFLDLNLSLRALTERINALLDTLGIDLPKATNSMLSRLKREMADTSHKQNVLRSFAVWIGYERSHLISQWNFESLRQLCRGGKQPMEHKAGVRIGFSLSGRGDVIDHDIVDWLKKSLKNYIETAIGSFSYGRWGKVRSQDITTLYVDFPKEEHFNSPATYRKCLRSAVSLAHQIAIRWTLTPYCSHTRFLAIGIATGEFATLNNYLLPILNTRLPGDPVIRLTDFTRQCVLINDIRAVLCDQPAEITLFNGENLIIWWVAGVWSALYFDFVPELLQDPLLGNDIQATSELFALLWGQAGNDPVSSPENKPNAVVAFLRFPHNFLLGLEIAKTLYYRRRFWDAVHILKVVLSLDPVHIHARSLAMVLYRNLAIDASKYAVAEGLFAQAQDEARFIMQNCRLHSEDFYCEYAMLYLSKAIFALRNMRAQNLDTKRNPENIDALKKHIFALLARADRFSGKAMMVSPSGIRALYLRSSVKIIIGALESDETIFTDPKQAIDGDPIKIRQFVTDYQLQYGIMREDPLPGDPFETMERIFATNIQNHDDSIALQAYRPTTLFCAAVCWWDFFPVRTVGIAKRVIELLKNSVEISREMEKEGVCIYALTRIYGEMLPAKEFIRHMDRSIKMIEAYCGKDLCQRRNSEVITPKDPNRFSMLMTLNF